MKIFGINISISRKSESVDAILRRLDALVETAAGIHVTPESCEEAPTVQAIVNSISLHFQSLPIHLYRKTLSNGRESKEPLPSHPVARLLSRPNAWQTSADYWGDAASVLVRHGRFFAIKLQGNTGPIRRLIPVYPGAVEPLLDEQYNPTFRITPEKGGQRIYEAWEVHHARQRANDFLNGNSPVHKARDAIALEIAAQKYGSEFFGNGAQPGLIFKYAEHFRGHQSSELREKFLESVQQAYGAKKRFRAMLLPHGIGDVDKLNVDNEAMQFLDTRKLQRNVIAGAFGVPPHLVGDLERGTFSNIEHQSQEFLNKVILPYARVFESAMERDLLSDDDRRSGVVVRFNLDAIHRADFKTRQEGLKIQREMGVINADEWREREGMNPIPDGQGGDVYWQEGPSGQNMQRDRDTGTGTGGNDDVPDNQRTA